MYTRLETIDLFAADLLPCKILKRIVCKHILEFLDHQQLLTPQKHGFRKGHSCESQLHITMDNQFIAVNKWTLASLTSVELLILSLMSAYWGSWHSVVYWSLNRWIRAFLTCHTMWVVCEGESSDAACTCAIRSPQGPVTTYITHYMYYSSYHAYTSTTCPVNYRLKQWLDSSQMTAWSTVGLNLIKIKSSSREIYMLFSYGQSTGGRDLFQRNATLS